MVVLDITESTFIETDTEEANEWMSKNVGKLKYDRISKAGGVGWYLVHDENERWLMHFGNDAHASLFLLRWS
jgi:hypothetical protein